MDGISYLIWESTPYRVCSSGVNKPGTIPADRSFCMPACFPRMKLAMMAVVVVVVVAVRIALSSCAADSRRECSRFGENGETHRSPECLLR